MNPISLLLTLCLLLPAGCALFAGAPPGTAEEHRSRAEGLVSSRDYAGAADELAHALRLAPRDGELYLRAGEVLEAADRSQEAADIYDRGRRALPADEPLQAELAWRLALLQALRLDRPQRAEELLPALPAASAARADLEGVLALAEGKPREALILFSSALQRGPQKQTAAAILYHAALAYHRLGDEKNTFGSLYQAINLAEHLGLTRDIEAFFRALSQARPAP
jgi:tetratricopeptide (TPR) repeat protein